MLGKTRDRLPAVRASVQRAPALAWRHRLFTLRLPGVPALVVDVVGRAQDVAAQGVVMAGAPHLDVEQAIRRVANSIFGEDHTVDYWRQIAKIMLSNDCVNVRGHRYGDKSEPGDGLGTRCMHCGRLREGV